MAVNAQGRDTQFMMLHAETCQNTSRRETNLKQQRGCTQETKHFLAFDFSGMGISGTNGCTGDVGILEKVCLYVLQMSEANIKMTCRLNVVG